MKILRLLAPLFLLAATAFGQVSMLQAPGQYTDTSIPVRSGTYNKFVDAPGLTYNNGTGALSATTFIGAFSGTATNTTNIGITNDTTTNATMFPLWVTANTGNLPAKVTSTKLSFNPSTGILTSTGFVGTLNGNTFTTGTYTLTGTAGKTLTFTNSVTLTGTDGTTMTFPTTTATIARTDAGQTFTGVQAMTSPAITTSITTPSTTFALLNTTATTINAFGGASVALNMGNASGSTAMLGIIGFDGATPSSSTAAIFPAGTTALSSFRVPHGAAPTSPVNGDFWTTTSGLFGRINGATVAYGAAGGTVSSGTTNVLSKYTASTTVGNSLLTDDATTLTYTGTGGASAVSFNGSGTTPAALTLAAGTGSIPALAANSAGFAAPATGGTAYLLKLPATITGGVPVYAAPATNDGVNESAISVVAPGTSGNVLRSNGTTWTSAAPSVVPGTFAPNPQTGTTYTLGSTDLTNVNANGSMATLVSMNNASSNTLTVPLNATTAFPIGTNILVQQLGAGVTTIAATGGVTINTPSTLIMGTQYAIVSLIKTATDTWQLGAASLPAGLAIVGVSTNSNAAAGVIGEYATATVATGSSVTLTSAATSTVTSVNLTAGDWDVWGVADYTAGATTSITNFRQGISTTAATLGSQDTFTSDSFAAMVPTAAIDLAKNTPTARISLASTTTVYLVANSTFTISTLKAYGTIFARRRR